MRWSELVLQSGDRGILQGGRGRLRQGRRVRGRPEVWDEQLRLGQLLGRLLHFFVMEDFEYCTPAPDI